MAKTTMSAWTQHRLTQGMDIIQHLTAGFK